MSGPQGSDQGKRALGRPRGGHSAPLAGTVPSSLHAECTTGKPHGQLWYCLHLDSIFSLATPTVGSLGICHLLYRWSLSLFPPGFTPISLESSAEGVTPGVHHACVHHNIARSACVFGCLSICGHNTDDSILIWTILNFPSLPMAIVVTSFQKTESDPEVIQNLLLFML